MPIIKILTQTRETLVEGIYWLAELEPIYFGLFLFIYVAAGTFIIGASMLWAN